VRLYATGIRVFLAWCDRQGRPATLDRPTVAAFVAELLNGGKEAATARARQLALRRFAAWLVEEGELDADPLVGLKPPKLDSKVIPVLSGRQLRALLAACQGPAPRWPRRLDPYAGPCAGPYARDLRTPHRLDGGIAAGRTPSGERSGRAVRSASRD